MPERTTRTTKSATSSAADKKVASLEKELKSLKSELASLKKAVADSNQKALTEKLDRCCAVCDDIKADVEKLKNRPVKDPRVGKLTSAVRSLLQPAKRKELGL